MYVQLETPGELPTNIAADANGRVSDLNISVVHGGSHEVLSTYKLRIEDGALTLVRIN